MSTSRRHRRRWPWLLALLVLVLLVAAVAWSALAARTIAAQATTAQTQIVAAKAALVAGDAPAARAALVKARTAVDTAADAADILPLRVAGALPWVSTPVSDVDALVSAAGMLVTSSDQLVDVYGAVSSEGARPIFADGAVDLEVVAGLSPKVDAAVGEIDAAISRLRAVQGTFPGTGRLAQARDTALAEAVPLRDQLAGIQPVLPMLPAALGADGRKTYLLTVLNPAELRASGGAPLSVALLRFTDGKLSMPLQGSTTTVLPGVPLVSWHHLTKAPFATGDQPQRFVNANQHPDFRISGEELARAWKASGQGSVDGVIAVDTTALAAVLKVTGPVQSEGFGEITADNLVQKLLVDAYQDYSDDQQDRKSLNDELATAFFQRLGSGSGFLPILKALGSVAGGRHFQLNLRDDALQTQVEKYGYAGAVADGTDVVGAFSQNANGSKTDVFQQRSIDQTVNEQADGLRVVREVQVALDTPSQLTSAVRIGYLTSWNRSRWFFYLPPDARHVTLRAPDGFTAPETFRDGLGRRFVTTIGWIAGGDTAKFSVRYRIGTPADGYSVAAQPQPMVGTTNVSLTVPTHLLADPLPAGWVATGDTSTWTGTLDAGPEPVPTD
ncbi:MAG TPA: DUF4012 domain-containing protein [Candidatus Nanopelagicales bacterium]|nr:DUF4012 domain-containing protein [Candidatus Nanopelagicales bacterium]